LTAFFDGDDDELLKSLQRQSKVHCIKQLLFVCRQFQDRAELFVGVQAQDHWNGDKVETSDFDEVIEVIAADATTWSHKLRLFGAVAGQLSLYGWQGTGRSDVPV